MELKVNVRGIQEATQSLALLDRKVQRKLAIKALLEGGKPLKARAKEKAPSGRTGNLKRSIAIKSLRGKSRLVKVEVVARRGKSRNDRNGAWYAHFVEFGKGGQAAQPFLRNSADATKKDVKDDTGKALMKQVDAEFRS